jgi:aminobenzoyl-glutamate transport protein
VSPPPSGTDDPAAGDAGVGRLQRGLARLERAGDTWHPAVVLLLLGALVLVASALAATLGAEATDPTSGETIRAVNLLDAAGIGGVPPTWP